MSEHIKRVAAMCWRAGCDEKDGQARIEAILLREFSAAIPAETLDQAIEKLEGIGRAHEPQGERGRCWACGIDGGCWQMASVETALSALRAARKGK